MLQVVINDTIGLRGFCRQSLNLKNKYPRNFLRAVTVCKTGFLLHCYMTSLATHSGEITLWK